MKLRDSSKAQNTNAVFRFQNEGSFHSEMSARNDLSLQTQRERKLHPMWHLEAVAYSRSLVSILPLYRAGDADESTDAPRSTLFG
jgi:hypothetical protein